MKTKQIFLIITFLAFLLFLDPAMAQLPSPILPGPPPQAPLGGLGVLALAGGAYAINKLRKRTE